MLAITEKPAIFKKKYFFEALQLENTYSNKSNSLWMNNAWYIIKVIQDWLFWFCPRMGEGQKDLPPT